MLKAILMKKCEIGVPSIWKCPKKRNLKITSNSHLPFQMKSSISWKPTYSSIYRRYRILKKRMSFQWREWKISQKKTRTKWRKRLLLQQWMSNLFSKKLSRRRKNSQVKMKTNILRSIRNYSRIAKYSINTETWENRRRVLR